VKLVDTKKPGLPLFAEVRPLVVADLTRKKQEEAAVLTLKQALAKDGSLEAVAKDLKLSLEKPEAFGKAGPVPGLGAQKVVLDAAFGGNAGETAGPVGLAGRGAVALRILRDDLRQTRLRGEKERLRESVAHRRRRA